MSNLVPEEVREAMARALYEQEKKRSEHANAIISGTGLCIEPYEECADSCWRSDADAALSALASAGWVCVPKEATHEMLLAAMQRAPVLGGYSKYRDAWPAMLTASRHKEKSDV